jgi:hypothetical protein
MPQDRKFRRRVRERMAKTGESYSTARHNLSADDPDSQSSSSKSLHQTSAPQFAIHTAFATSPLRRTSPERQETLAAREKRIWTQIEKQTRRIGASRGLILAIKARGLALPELEQVARNLAALPMNYFQLVEAEAERMRLLVQEVAQKLEDSQVVAAIRQFEDSTAAKAIQQVQENIAAAVRQVDEQVEESVAAIRQLVDSPAAKIIQQIQESTAAAVR